MANANGVDVGFWLVVWQIVGQAIPSAMSGLWRQGKGKLERPSETDSGTERAKTPGRWAIGSELHEKELSKI